MKIKALVVAAATASVLCACSAGASDNHKEGMELYNAGKYEQAKQYLQAAVAENNHKGIYYVDLGMNYIEIGDYSQAKEAFDHAVSIGDEDELAYRGLGIMCMEAGQYADAVAYFDKAVDAIELEIGELETDILKYRAQALIKAEDYDRAIKAYDALIALGIEPNWNLVNKGHAYLLKGDGTDAVNCYNNALAADGNVEYYISIYNTFNCLGLYEQGYSYLNKALEVEGDSDEAHLNRGKIYYICGNYSSALTEFSYPYKNGNAVAAKYTAFCYEKQDKLDEAIDAYYQSLSVVNDPEVCNYLAMCLAAKGEYNLAWSMLHTTMEDNPNCSCMQTLKWNEIVLYEKMERFSSAYTRLLEYLEMYPSNAVTDKELAFLKLKQ